MIQVAKVTCFMSCYLFDLSSGVGDGLPRYALGTVYGAAAPALRNAFRQSLELLKWRRAEAHKAHYVRIESCPGV
jgi:hypothetical protein